MLLKISTLTVFGFLVVHAGAQPVQPSPWPSAELFQPPASRHVTQAHTGPLLAAQTSSRAPAGPLTYSVTQLGSLRGEANSFYSGGDAINDSGAAVASSFADSERNDLYLTSQGFYWKEGALKALPLVPGYSGAFALGITNNGLIYGTANKAGSGSSVYQIAVIWEDGRPVIVGPNQPNLSSAIYQMNDHGTAPVILYPPDGNYIPAALQSGQLRLLPTPAGVIGGSANGVNGVGIISGTLDYGPNPPPNTLEYHACLWIPSNGTWNTVQLAAIEGYDTGATAVNDREEVVGVGIDPNFTLHALYWSKGKVVDLGMLPGGLGSAGDWINNRGEIVGDATRADGTDVPVIFQDGTVSDLNDLVPPGTPLLQGPPNGINDHGEIAVNAVMPDGTELAVLLKPVNSSE